MIIQKAAQASVTSSVPEQPVVTSSIARGVMVLVGFEKDDTETDVQAMCKQLLKLRLFDSSEDPPKRNALNLADAQRDLLLVSQFTLAAQFKSGRPTFHKAKEGAVAKDMFAQFAQLCRDGLPSTSKVESGVFGSWMQVHLINEGPFTVCLSCKDGKCDAW